MVWTLSPVGSLPGAQAYYIFAKGTYKVGRKGSLDEISFLTDCDVVIQNDKAVSRLHAEIIVDTMSPSGSTNTNVRVKDLSKFGTFVNKEKGTKAVNSHPNREADLKDRDVISFGTGNASFRFYSHNLIVCIGSLKNASEVKSIQAIVTSIGARATTNWNVDCTHMLAEESSPLSVDLIDAILTKKPVITSDWLKILAEKGIQTEMPDCSIYSPTVTVNGTSVKIVDPKVREKCVEGYTFILKSAQLYKFGSKLASLLNGSGANTINFDDFSSNSQVSSVGGKSQLVLVDTSKSASQPVGFVWMNSLARVDEAELICAVLSGHIEIHKAEPPPILVSSSHSTDETVVADSDVEVDTATTNYPSMSAEHVTRIKYDSDDHAKDENEDVVCDATRIKYDIDDHAKDENEDAVCDATIGTCGENSRLVNSTIQDRYPVNEVDASAGVPKEKLDFLSSRSESGLLVQRKHEGDDLGASAHQNTDIIYDQNLVVRKIQIHVRPVSEKNVLDFKHFRKSQVLPGNTFNDLIPFSKDPYNASDFQNNDVAVYVREEKKRKQMEAIAEDLFNNAKTKKGKTTGDSLFAILKRT